MNSEMLTIAKEELEIKKEFLLELTNRVQTNINNWNSKDLQKTIKTINTMNNVTLEIAQLETEIKFRKRMDK